MTHLVFAQETAASPLPSLLFLGLMVAVFWLFIIRPQRQRQAQQELSKTLSPGEEVRTIGGIHGIVVSVDDESVVLRVEEERSASRGRPSGPRWARTNEAESS